MVICDWVLFYDLSLVLSCFGEVCLLDGVILLFGWSIIWLIVGFVESCYVYLR